MLNLLPDQQKNAIKKEYRLRLAVIVLLFLVGILITFLIFSLPAYVSVRSRLADATRRNETAKEQLQSIQGNGAMVTENDKLTLALLESDKSPSYSLTDLINMIVSEKGNAIMISNLSYSQTADGTSITVTGSSETREDLIAFKQQLEKNKAWASVDLPLSSLGPAKNNKFSITLNGITS